MSTALAFPYFSPSFLASAQTEDLHPATSSIIDPFRLVDNDFSSFGEQVLHTDPVYTHITKRRKGCFFNPALGDEEQALAKLGLEEDSVISFQERKKIVREVEQRDRLEGEDGPFFYRFRGGRMLYDASALSGYKTDSSRVFSASELVRGEAKCIDIKEIGRLYQDSANYLLDIRHESDTPFDLGRLAESSFLTDFSQYQSALTVGQFLESVYTPGSDDLQTIAMLLALSERREYLREKYQIDGISDKEKQATLENMALFDIGREVYKVEDEKKTLRDAVKEVIKSYEKSDEDITRQQAEGQMLEEISAKYLVRVARHDTPTVPYSLVQNDQIGSDRGDSYPTIEPKEDSFGKKFHRLTSSSNSVFKTVVILLLLLTTGKIGLAFYVARLEESEDGEETKDRTEAKANRQLLLGELNRQADQRREALRKDTEEKLQRTIFLQAKHEEIERLRRLIGEFVKSVESYELISSEYTQYETDPEYLLTHPSIRDVSVPATARFVEVFVNCGKIMERVSESLDGLNEVEDIPEEAMESFVSEISKETLDSFVEVNKLVADLEKAWDQAIRSAEQIVESGLSHAQQRRMRRLLSRILHPANDLEQQLDIEALQKILDSISYVDESNATRNLQGAQIMKKTTTALYGGRDTTAIEG